MVAPKREIDDYEVDGQLHSLKKSFSVLQAERVDLYDTIAELENEITKLKGELEGYSKSNNIKNTRISNLAYQLENMTQRRNELKDEIKELKGLLKSHEWGVESHPKAIEIRKDIISLRKCHAEQIEELNEFHEKVDLDASTISDLNDEIKELELKLEKKDIQLHSMTVGFNTLTKVVEDMEYDKEYNSN